MAVGDLAFYYTLYLWFNSSIHPNIKEVTHSVWGSARHGQSMGWGNFSYPNNGKKNWGNHDISVNGIWREIFSLKLCSSGRKHFVYPWAGSCPSRGATQEHCSTHAWTKKTRKKGLFQPRMCKTGNTFRGLNCHFSGKRGGFCQNFYSNSSDSDLFRGQIWSKIPQILV